LEAYADTIDERFTDYTNQLREIDEGVDEVMDGMADLNTGFDEFREKTKQKVDELHSYADKIETSAKYVEDNLYKVEYNPENPDD
jgi:allophanate hydrolase subunit 1